MERPDQYDPNDYEFIRARLSDNPIYANDTSYRKTLEALPTHLRDAFLYGSWDIFAGQYFDIFDRKKHVTRVTDLKSWYPRWISIDWGFAHNFAVYWHTTLSDGRFATYREFVDSGLEPDVLVAKIAGLSKGEHISDIYISPDTDARRDSPDTIYKQMGKQFESLGLPHCRKADDDRKGGWLLLHQLLKNECLVIDESCVNLIDKIPTAVRDPNDIEDIEKCDGDDEIDAWRYGYKSRLEPAQAPLEVRMEGNLASLETETDQYGRPISRTAIMNRLAVLRKREEEATTGMPWTLKIN
jgi:phage terminase large subunit